MDLEQGDYFEVNFKDSIRQLISNYEAIWGCYIGHDGNGRMIIVNWLSDEEKRIREKFAEHFYTCMESIICINCLAQNCNTVDIMKPSEYINLINTFMSFQAHAGRVRDNAIKILGLHLNQNRANEIISQLEEIYQQRNQVLHGKKLPIRIEDSLVLIAPPMGKEDISEKWNSNMNWSDFPNSNFEFIKDYLKSTVNQISISYNNLLGNLIGPINDLVRKKNINLDQLLQNSYDSHRISGYQGPISGSTF